MPRSLSEHGPRCFAPLEDVGLIVVDEEHEGSFKQGEMPRYHARDSAIMRAKMADAPVVLGSATPSMESFRNAELKRYGYVQLPVRVENRPLPEVEIVNMRDEYARQGKQVMFSTRLLDALEDRLEGGGTGDDPAEPPWIFDVSALSPMWLRVHL